MKKLFHIKNKTYTLCKILNKKPENKLFRKVKNEYIYFPIPVFDAF